MSQYQPEDRARLKRYWSDQAIDLAIKGQWEQAIATNRSILTLFPDDAAALARLGKASMEFGRYGDARTAYRRVLELEPGNTIAQKNLVRLQSVHEDQVRVVTAERMDPRLFIEETGKTTVTSLVNLHDRDALARMTAGDQVYLEARGTRVLIKNAKDEYLGELEPRLSNRLITFMEGGNRYAAALTSIDERATRVIVREMYQHPSQAGRVSFPVKGDAGYRAYIKDTMLRHDRDEDELTEDGEYVGDNEAENEDLTEVDFDEEDDPNATD